MHRLPGGSVPLRSQIPSMTRASHTAARPSALLQFSILGYVGIVLVASLYPFTGGRVPEMPWLVTQFTEWPRYYTYTDMVMNVMAYLPFGLLLTLWLGMRMRMMPAASYAVVTAALFSLLVEVVQAGMPTRVPSGLDVFCNATGALIGAWITLLSGTRPRGAGPVARWRAQAIIPGAAGDAMIVLLVLWVVMQFKPDHWLFALGDVRHLSLSPDHPSLPDGYRTFEMAVAAAGTAALAGAVGFVTPGRRWPWFALLLLSGLVLRSLASLLFFRTGTLVQWMTPGNLAGLALGLLLAAGILRQGIRVAGLAGVAATVILAMLVNAAPTAELAHPLPVELWRQSHLRSVAGAAQALAVLWPALAVWTTLTARTFAR